MSSDEENTLRLFNADLTSVQVPLDGEYHTHTIEFPQDDLSWVIAPAMPQPPPPLLLQHDIGQYLPDDSQLFTAQLETTATNTSEHKKGSVQIRAKRKASQQPRPSQTIPSQDEHSQRIQQLQLQLQQDILRKQLLLNQQQMLLLRQQQQQKRQMQQQQQEQQEQQEQQPEQQPEQPSEYVNSSDSISNLTHDSKNNRNNQNTFTTKSRVAKSLKNTKAAALSEKTEAPQSPPSQPQPQPQPQPPPPYTPPSNTEEPLDPLEKKRESVRKSRLKKKLRLNQVREESEMLESKNKNLFSLANQLVDAAKTMITAIETFKANSGSLKSDSLAEDQLASSTAGLEDEDNNINR